jgi:hypothetical protein
MRRHLTYANLTATLALLLAVGTGGTFAANQLAARSVGAPQLRPGAVTAAKIRKNAVTSPKISAEAVTQGKIATAAVSADKLALGAVTSDRLSDGAVVTAKLASDAVTGEKVAEGTLGQVPSAVSADQASFAESANPVAFARVAKSGTLDGSASKGIASVSEVEAGVYCVTPSSFFPRGAQVTPQFEGIGSIAAFVRIGGAAVCPPPEVEVQTWNGGTKAEAPFFVVFYR